MLTALIVDDEPLARQRLRTLLSDCTDCQRTTVAEAGNAGEALALLGPTGGRGFDVLLLDIHMPGQDGLSLAHAVQALPQPPAVVFVTAYADHAVSAFELDAVDYLTKPVRRERLQQALAKVQRLQRPSTPAPISTLPEGETLLIQDRGRTERLPLAEVLYLKAEQKYVTLRTATRSHLLDDSLTELEKRLGRGFIRIHRTHLVNKNFIHQYIKDGSGKVKLYNGELIDISKRKKSYFLQCWYAAA